ncbi:hypothetical protein GCM10028857_15910 [Salinarchaeum chitinilyticum]
MQRAVAINVGANSSLPGFRGPISPAGRAVYVPIPEREPIAEAAVDAVPTYADLDLDVEIPDPHRDTRLHLDPSFAEYPHCSDYTYGDEHGVKAAPLLDLDAGDLVLFYATLRTVDHGAGDAEPPCGRSASFEFSADDREETPTDWRPPSWGAFVIGVFELDRDPIPGEDYEALPASDRDRLAENAHVRRETTDAAVFLLGDPDRSRLLDTAIPLSTPSGGTAANRIVTELSADSGKGPWWRRPLRFDGDATAALQPVVEASR